MRANAPQLPGGGWAQLELTGALMAYSFHVTTCFQSSVYKMQQSVFRVTTD